MPEINPIPRAPLDLYPRERPTVIKGRLLVQIGATILFEGRRHFKKPIFLSIIFSVIAIIFFVVFEVKMSPPPTAAGYISNFLIPLVQILIVIPAILFGGSIIVEDFERQTGNLLFPQIPRGRLLFGRFVMRLAYGSLALFVYYAEIAIFTYLNYETIPLELWGSFGWAVMNYYMYLSLVVILSAALNRNATAMVASFGIYYLAQTLYNLFQYSQSLPLEPLYNLVYYNYIIFHWLNMPVSRCYEFMGYYRNWITPSAEGAFWGMFVYSAIFLLCAFLLYRRKQLKAR